MQCVWVYLSAESSIRALPGLVCGNFGSLTYYARLPIICSFSNKRLSLIAQFEPDIHTMIVKIKNTFWIIGTIRIGIWVVSIN